MERGNNKLAGYWLNEKTEIGNPGDPRLKIKSYEKIS